MTYQALARKYRPKRFEAVVGQQATVTALSNALNNNKIHHAYLFTGTHGVGKTTLARIFAKSLNCLKGISAAPCDTCEHCQEIDGGRFPDLFEIDAASRTKVEDTRELLDNIPFSASKGRFKVYLIDEVHMLSGHSFNALLKTLEEPPAHVKFLLATTDPQKLPATVLSRCLQFHLAQMTSQGIIDQLQSILAIEKINAETEALVLLSKSAHGSMRDALSLLDQAIAYSAGNLTTSAVQQMLGITNTAHLSDLLSLIADGDAQQALAMSAQWGQEGVNFKRVLADLLSTLHEIAIIQATKQNPTKALAHLVNSLTPETVQLYYQIALMGQQDLPHAPSLQVGFEMIIIRLIAFQPANITIKASQQAQTTPKASAPTKKTPASTQHPSNNNWLNILNSLDIKGPTRAFAEQCNLAFCDKQQMTLIVSPKHSALLSDRLKARLNEALNKHFNAPMLLTINVEEPTASTKTPAQQKEAAQAQRKESAKTAFTSDPTVQRIVDTFDAKLVDDSVEVTTQ